MLIDAALCAKSPVTVKPYKLSMSASPSRSSVGTKAKALTLSPYLIAQFREKVGELVYSCLSINTHGDLHLDHAVGVRSEITAAPRQLDLARR